MLVDTGPGAGLRDFALFASVRKVVGSVLLIVEISHSMIWTFLVLFKIGVIGGLKPSCMDDLSG